VFAVKVGPVFALKSLAHTTWLPAGSFVTGAFEGFDVCEGHQGCGREERGESAGDR